MGCNSSKATNIAETAPKASASAPAATDGDAPTLYINALSPVARACVMVAAELGVKVNIKEIDLFKGEGKSEEYLKINPNGTVPSMTHGDVTICESVDIAKYLVKTFGKGSSLYPDDAAQVDEVMGISQSVVYPLSGKITMGAFTGSTPDEDSNAMAEETRKLHALLGDKNFLCGDEMTIADLFVFSHLTNTKVNSAYKHPDPSEIGELITWGERIRARPYFASTHKNFFAVLQSMSAAAAAAAPALPAIYINYLSPVSRSVAAIAAELNLEVEIKILDLLKGEHKSEEYLKINPNGTVPSFVDGETMITQSRDIGKHMAGGKPLYPEDEATRKKIDEILVYDDTEIFKMLGKIALPILLGKPPAGPEVHAEMHEKMLHVQEVLGDNNFLAGDTMTIADVFVFNNFKQTEMDSTFSPPEGAEKLMAWGKRMSENDNVMAQVKRFKGILEAMMESRKAAE